MEGAAALPPPASPAPLVHPDVKATPLSRRPEHKQGAHSAAGVGVPERWSGVRRTPGRRVAEVTDCSTAHPPPPLIRRVLNPSQGPPARQPSRRVEATVSSVPAPRGCSRWASIESSQARAKVDCSYADLRSAPTGADRALVASTQSTGGRRGPVGIYGDLGGLMGTSWSPPRVAPGNKADALVGFCFRQHDPCCVSDVNL